MTIGTFGSALLFATVGILFFPCALFVVARLLPGNLWHEALTNRSVPAAVILAGVAIALGSIIAAAVH